MVFNVASPLGFRPSDVEPLRAELLKIATDSEESTSVAFPHGTKLIAHGTIILPTGRRAPPSPSGGFGPEVRTLDS